MEVELKYSASDPEALVAWISGGALAEAGLALGPERASQFDDRYVDSADGRLRAGGFAARLRIGEGQVTVSLKSRDTEGDTTHGRHQRVEIEAPAVDSPDPSAWPESEPRAVVQRLAGGEQLRERFRIRQRRREWAVTRIESSDGSGPRTNAQDAATLSLQAVEVFRAGRLLGEQDALEVELLRGDEAILRAIAAALEPTGLVEPESTSKEELAETLVGLASGDGLRPRDDDDDSLDGSRAPGSGAPVDGSAVPAIAGDPADEGGEPPLVVPRSPGLRPDDSLADAGRKVLGMHLARMLAREAGTRSGDVEDLHKMRVATRRMRAAWRTFEGAYRPKRARRYVRELKAVADRLGAVRDLDVQLEALAAYAETAPAQAAALAPLAETWQHRRDVARDELLAALDGSAYQRFVEDYQAFVAALGDAEDQQAEPGVPTRVRDTAGGRIWVAYEHL
nr:CHAD domain-containing protein [Chloroflexota bacterium]